jgi:hypothetical protein
MPAASEDPSEVTAAPPVLAAPSARPASTLPEELELVERARRHLASSPETALQELAQHRARHPLGALAAERDVLELEALRRTGRVEDARIRAKDLLEREPNGLFAERVRAFLRSL